MGLTTLQSGSTPFLFGFTYAVQTTVYSYNKDGLLTGSGPFAVTRNAGNGLQETVNDSVFSMSPTFNGYGEIETQGAVIGGYNMASWTLGHNRIGRITSKIQPVDGVVENYAYTYDAASRLEAVTKDGVSVEEYAYDINGTRIFERNALKGISGRSFTYSDEDHLLSAGDVTYQYNVDGFLTSKTNGTEVTAYDYSSRGELLSVSLPDGRILEYIHDPLGRRIAKKINAVTVEKYLWSGFTRLLAVFDGAGALKMRFEYADARMPVSVTMAGGTYYLAYDQVGSLRVVVDGAGNVVKGLEYDSFGNVIFDINPAFEISFGFAGGFHDRDTDLVRFGYRDYDPGIGRWTAKDPILFAGGDTDLFGYVLNNPVNFVDSWGLLTADWHHFITLVAALNSGMGLRDSLRLSWNASTVDFAPGSQGFGAEATAQHAMAGILPNGRPQSSQEAIDATNDFIQNNKACGNIAQAAHAAQDLATPGHAGQPWTGFGWNWNTVSHILGDLVPSPSTISQAYRNTLRALK